jgi:hypothetical protein
VTPELEQILKDIRKQRNEIDAQLDSTDHSHRSVEEILRKLQELRLRADKTSRGDLEHH